MTKIWNDNRHPHKEMFKGKEIVIPAGECIEMEYEEAIEFKGQYTPMPPAEFNGDESVFYKMLRVEPVDPKLIVPDEGHVNHATGKRFESVDKLRQSLEEVRHLLVKDDDAEKADKVPNSEVEELRKQVSDLQDLVKSLVPQKKKPGPKPKVASA